MLYIKCHNVNVCIITTYSQIPLTSFFLTVPCHLTCRLYITPVTRILKHPATNIINTTTRQCFQGSVYQCTSLQLLLSSVNHTFQSCLLRAHTLIIFLLLMVIIHLTIRWGWGVAENLTSMGDQFEQLYLTDQWSSFLNDG